MAAITTYRTGILMALLALSLIGLSAPVNSQSLSSREYADWKAKQAFLSLNFFSEGRGMHTMPRVLGVYDAARATPLTDNVASYLLQRRWGVNMVQGAPVGMYGVEYHGMTVGVFGCAACHCGKAAGYFIPGLGNKNIDIGRTGRDAYLGQRLFRQAMGWPSAPCDYPQVEASALRFAAYVSNPQLDNMTQGMVPVSFIRKWFFDQAGEPMPPCPPRSSVKVPFLWGYGKKRPVGQFCDGFGNADKPGWAIAVELVGGQRPETVRKYFHEVEDAEKLFSDFLPPPCPVPMNLERAAKGKLVFQNACQCCHGVYDRDRSGYPVYRAPKWIPAEVVGTDTDRLDGNDAHFLELVARSPLCDLLKANHYGRGYFSPRLNGIWSRFPYLHNASVPNLAAMLTPPERRPAVFSLKDAGEACRFDPVQMGLTVPDPGSLEEIALRHEARRGARNVYWTRRIGHSNTGHSFGTDLQDEDKCDLIEYLKTL